MLSSHLQCPGAGTVGFNPPGWGPDPWNTGMLEKTALSVAKLLEEMLLCIFFSAILILPQPCSGFISSGSAQSLKNGH